MLFDLTKESEMNNKYKLIAFNVFISFFAVVLVGYSATIQPEVKADSFTVKKSLLKATWNDQFGKPGYEVVETEEGDCILRIHGGEDGKVWAGEFQYSCDLDVVIRNLGVKVTRVMCCYPAKVRAYSGVKLPFFFPEHDGCLWSAHHWTEGKVVKVYSTNPN